MKKFFVSFLIVSFILSGLTPVVPMKKSEANPLFVVAAALSIVQTARDLGRSGEKANLPEVWLGSSFDARVAQPEVGLPDSSGWRKIVFPYDLLFTVKLGYIAKFWSGKSTEYIQFGGDVVKLKKGEPVWVKMTSALQEILDQVGGPVFNAPVVLAPAPQPGPPPMVVQTPTSPVMSMPSEAIDIASLPVRYLPGCQGWSYRGPIRRVYVSNGTRVDWWDHTTQTAKVAYTGETFLSGDFTWFK